MRTLAGMSAALLLATALPAAAQTAARPRLPTPDPERAGRPVLNAVHAMTAPVLDGRLDDAVWQRAPLATDFVQRSPHAGEPATERTEARVAFDDGAIYIAVRAYDSAPDSIASQLARRDATGIFSDWIDVIIDSYHDRRTAYRFSVNPHGVKKDVYHFNDGQEDLSWDAVWEVATAIDDEGWTAEFRIPLSQIRYAPSDDEQTWGIQFGRIIARRDEVSFWSPVTPNSSGFISLAGSLTGVRDLSAPKRLEVMPYVSSRVTRAPAPGGGTASPFWRRTDPAATAGADLKYGLTPNLTLTATINPDFGQVEADPAVVNLGAFESFFPERRPFFLEGASLFNFGIGDDGSGEGLFYSRRIGRAPQRTNLDADHVSMPDAARILGAGKLTGRVGDWSLGFFNAVTQAEHASIARGGEIEDVPVEPATNYAVGRLSRDFRNGGSSLGMLVTATNRRIDNDVFNFLRTSAYSAGVNGQHRFGPDRRYEVSGYLAASSIHGDTMALRIAQRAPQRYFQRPDADHVEFDPTRTSLQGLSGTFGLSKIGGGNWNGGVGTVFRTPGFEVNDMGFQQNADQRFVYGWFNYNSFEPGRVFRRWQVGFNPNAGWDFGGTRLWSQVNTWGNATFNNFWSVNWFANNRWSAMSTGALRGGPAMYSPGHNNLNFSINSDRRKSVFGSASTFAFREHGTGTLRWGANAGVTARPSARFDLSLHPGLNRNGHTWQYVTAPLSTAGDREYIFAELDQTTVSLTARLNYTFTRDLSLQLYAQPFISAGDYSSFRRVADPRAADFNTRFRTFGDDEISRDGRTYTATVADGAAVSFSDPDFTVRSLRSNAVLRWEYRPGSTLFLVWSHGRGGNTDTGAFDFGRGIEDLWRLQGTNTLMLKVNYWLNM
ncbi:MAG TPA: DUF5916 domain-containing protein [Longimicrobiales bacterium]|nr:DUF5916 domain-containing protein [Longimicrobiales bacterium]